MKKLIYLIGLAFLSSCVLASCKKKNDVQPIAKQHGWYLTSGAYYDADSIAVPFNGYIS